MDAGCSLVAFARDVFGPAATVTGVAALPGHSGTSVAFDVDTGAARQSLVIRTAPAGGPRSGTADMGRQARIMRALAGTDVPVPQVRWAGDGPPWFPAPFHVTDRVPGRVFQDWGPELPADPVAAYGRAADVLAAVHRVPVRRLPFGPESARDPAEEAAHWRRIAARTAGDALQRDLGKVYGLLVQTAPRQAPMTFAHGDFRCGNLVYDGGRVAAVLDWEIAGLGPPLLDVAWLLLFLDSARWYGSGVPAPDEAAATVRDRYRRATGDPLADLDWYQALARYRWAVIIRFNLMLHLRGKRDDPIWYRMDECVPALLGEARDLLGVTRRG